MLISASEELTEPHYGPLGTRVPPPNFNVGEAGDRQAPMSERCGLMETVTKGEGWIQKGEG